MLTSQFMPHMRPWGAFIPGPHGDLIDPSVGAQILSKEDTSRAVATREKAVPVTHSRGDQRGDRAIYHIVLPVMAVAAFLLAILRMGKRSRPRRQGGTVQYLVTAESNTTTPSRRVSPGSQGAEDRDVYQSHGGFRCCSGYCASAGAVPHAGIR